MKKCNCGRETKYGMFVGEDEQYVQSCNKYSVCLPYDEVLTQRDNYCKLLKELLVSAEGLTMFREGTKNYNESIANYQRIYKEVYYN